MKYYLIEEYRDYSNETSAGVPEPPSITTLYEVSEFKTAEALKKALLEGPRYGGRLIPAKGLELKVELKED